MKSRGGKLAVWLMAMALLAHPVNSDAASQEEKATETAWEWARESGLSEQYEQAESLKASTCELDKQIQAAEAAQQLVGELSRLSSNLAEMLLAFQHQALDATDAAGDCVKAHALWMSGIADAYAANAPNLQSITGSTTMTAAYERVARFGQQLANSQDLVGAQRKAQLLGQEAATTAALVLAMSQQALDVHDWWVAEHDVNPSPYSVIKDIRPTIKAYYDALDHQIRLLDAFEDARRLIVEQMLREWRQLISHRVSTVAASESSRAASVLSELRRSEAYVAEARAQLGMAKTRIEDLVTHYHSPVLARRLVAATRAYQNEIRTNVPAMNIPVSLQALSLAHLEDHVAWLDAFVRNHRLNASEHDAMHDSIRRETVGQILRGGAVRNKASECAELLDAYDTLEGAAEQSCYVKLVAACLP